MKDRRWYRRFELLLLNYKTLEECWSSGELEVVSKEILLPTISNLILAKDNDDLYAMYNVNYKAQEDFSYINNHCCPSFFVPIIKCSIRDTISE